MGRNNQQRRRAKAKVRTARTSGAAFRTAAQGDGRRTAASAQGNGHVAEQVRDLVHLALRTWRHDRLTADVAVSRLAELASGGVPGRLAVCRLLTAMLREHLAVAWQEGWQPVDLHRVAARGLAGSPAAPAHQRAVLLDAVADELGGYAPDAVDARWWAQLAELEAERWWPSDTDYLSARAGSASGGWAEVCGGAMAALDLIVWLPPLQVIGPRPGEATAATRETAARAAALDERILSRVRALLAKAESTPYEAEAETFTAGAQALMARHSIDAAMLDAAQANRAGPQSIRIGIDRPYETPKAVLLDAVAQANRCRTVWSQHFGFSTVVGFGPDLRAVETLFTSLLVQSTRAMQREGTRQTAWGQSRTRSFRQSFLHAFASRIGERLSEATRAEVDAATAGEDEPGAGVTTGGPTARHEALLPVLAARSRAVDDALEEMFPDMVQRTAGRISDAEGWHRGRAAADQATLDVFTPVGRSGS